MTTFARPVGIGQRLKQTRELLVLSDDCREEVSDCLAAGEAGATIPLLVEVGEDGTALVQEPPDPEPVDMDDDVAQVGQRLQCRPLPVPGRTAEPAWRRGLHNAQD